MAFRARIHRTALPLVLEWKREVGNFLATSDGGRDWTADNVPRGAAALDYLACPSTSICYSTPIAARKVSRLSPRTTVVPHGMIGLAVWDPRHDGYRVSGCHHVLCAGRNHGWELVLVVTTDGGYDLDYREPPFRSQSGAPMSVNDYLLWIWWLGSKRNDRIDH